MATLQEYMNRRNARSSSYDKYLQGTPRARVRSFWQEEDVATALYRQRREMEERREASRRELQEQIRRAQQNRITPVKQGSDAGFFEKTSETVLDIFGNILSGASKALEGVFDLGISGVGAVAGIFDKGVRDEMRRWVEYDVTGQHVQSTFDRLSDDSILNNSKAGRMVENVLQGVGQMLPTVAVSIATGGAALPAMLTVGASAAGNATEEAFNDGADYYRGLGYGVVSGGVEMLTEKALGGLGGVIGPGYLDNVIRSTATRTAATGVRRVLKEAAGEAAEEAVAELVNPLAKSIYKGRDALDDYSKAEYWQGVGESALVGGLTSAAYGGTVGRAMKASGKYGDVKETVDDIKASRTKRANLNVDGKWTDAREEAFHKREVANYRQIEKILQSATPKQRATMIKQNKLEGDFDADGFLTADKLRRLGENVTDEQSDTQGENAAQSVQFRFKEGKENRNQDLVDFYQSVLSMKDNAAKNKRKKKIGVVTQGHAALVSDLIKKETGKTIDLSDYEIWINGSAVNHIEDRHGKNGAADKSMADMDNVARIPWALDNATGGEVLKKDDGNLDLDYNHKNSDGSPSVKVRISKEVDNGLLFVAECAPDTNEKKLHILSAYMQQKSSEGQELTHKTQSPPQPTSETVLDSNTATNSIPQNSDLSTASGEKASGNFDHRFMSPDLWRREGEVRREIAKISEDSGEDISVLARDLSDEGKKQHTRLKKAFATLSEVSGGKLQMVVVEKNSTFTGAYAHGDTVYISADAVESGKWGEALIEESVHFTQGTQEHSLLRAFLANDTALLAKIESELTAKGNTYGFTAEDAEAFRAYLDGDADTELTGRALRYSNELTAHMSAELLSNEAVIDRLVGQHATLAERILIKFRQLGRAFAKDKALAKRVADAEQIYLAAIERRGWRYENGKIVGASDEELDSEEKVDYNRKGKGKTTHYISSQKIGTPTYVYIKKELERLYGEFDNMVADGIAISKGDKVYVVDSGKENGEVSFGVRKIRTVSDSENREKFIRRVNDDAVANGYISDGLSLEIKSKAGGDIGRYMRRAPGTELQIDSGKSENNHGGTIGETTGTRRVSSEPKNVGSREDKTYFRTKEQTSDDSPDATPKKKSKTKAEVLEDNARLREEKRKANERADERDDRLTLGERIGQKVSTLKGLRDGRMMAASEYKSDVLRGSIERLAQITYSRTVTGSVRHIIKDLSAWYVQGNPLLVDENAYDEDIAIMMQEIALGDEGKELSFGEMHMLDNILGHMLKIDERFNKVKKGGKYVEAKPYAEKYVRNIKDVRTNTTGFVQIMRSKFLRAFGDPLSLVRAFDAYAAEGFWTETYQEFRQAAVEMSVMEMDMMRDFEKFFEENKDFEKHLLQSTVTYRGQELRFDEAASLYMTTKRKQAQRGLVESYYTVLDDKGNKHDAEGFASRATGEGGKLSDIQIATICKQQREELWALFDEQERAYISMLEQTYEDMREIKREADFDIKGFSTVSEKGYYFPIRRDQVAKEIQSKLFEVDRVSHLSINKAVVEGANAGLIIEPASVVLRRYARTLSLYANFSIPMENYNRLLNLDVGGNVKNPTTVKRLVEQRNETKEMLQYIEKLAKDIQKIPNSDADRASFFKNPIGFLRSGYAKFQLGLNPKTWITQMSSLFAASGQLRYDCILAGLGTDSSDVDKYCRLAEVRNSENTAALAAGVLETTGKIGDVMMKPIGWMDRRVIKMLFGACQQQVAKGKGLKVGTEENKVAAGELLQQVILDTQQNAMITEKADWMRSDDVFKQANMMFKADAVKVLGRVFDGAGEISVLSRRLKNTTDPNERAAIEKQLKEARGRAMKSSGALISSAIFTAIIAQLFRSVYGKDDEKSGEEIAVSVLVDATGNMLGALPFISDAVEYVSHGYEADSFMVAMLNDVVKSTVDIISLAGEAASGKELSSQEIARTTRSAVYAVGQLYGIPVRNAYNILSGVTNIVSKRAKYQLDGIFNEPNFRSDLQAAIEADDERMIALIASMMMDERVGDIDKSLSDGLRPLVEGGYDVLPRAMGDSIVYDGEEVVLTKRQKKRFKEVYGIAEEQIASMMALRQYKEADDEVRARAIKLIWEAYYDLAVDDVLGVDSSEKNVLFAEAIDMDKLALIIATARSIKADVDARGKAINGSRLAKIEAYIEGLRLKAAQKHMVLGYLGYRNRNGEDKVRAYINTLPRLSKEEKRLLLEFSGYAA